MFSVTVLFVLASFLVVQSTVYLSDLTYTNTNFGIDFASKGAVKTGGAYFLLGSFASYNSTTKVKFEFTRDAACTSSCGTIQVFEAPTPMTSPPTKVIAVSAGDSLVFATDYEFPAAHEPTAKYFYGYVECCTYNVVASSSTKYTT
eukprot:Colp12_sorted_trinity150504_noHs@25667